VSTATRFEPGAASPDFDIPLSVPEIHGNEWTYVKDCLDQGWVSSAGAYVDRFEAMMAARVGARFAIATVNGTAAIHVALICAGVEQGDEVLVPALTFIAPANAVRYIGAWPVFMDVEPRYFQLDVDKVREFLEKECQRKQGILVNQRSGRRVRALLPVHILGHPCDMVRLVELARTYELPIIEDATESLGARVTGRSAGAIGEMGCYSFNGNKLITTGGGGMIVTNHEAWARRARYLTTQAKDDPVEYIHHEVGFNHRLTNLQAALGCAQMERLDEFITKKKSIAAAYGEALTSVAGITTMREASWAESVYWLYTIELDKASYGLDRRELMAHLATHRIQARPLWQVLSQSPAHRDAQAYLVEVAPQIQDRALSLPSSVGLRLDQVRQVCEVLRQAQR
jgi:perosamine synthetase